MKQVLVDNWKDAWKWMSVQLAAALALLDLAYEYLPAVQTYLPEGWVKWLAMAIIVGRLLNQNGKKGNP